VNFLLRLAMQEQQLNDSSRLDVEIARVPDMLPSLFPSWSGYGYISTPVLGLSNNLSWWKCGNEEETSIHILCPCENLASLRPSYLGSFFLDTEGIMNLTIGAIWNLAKGTGLF